MAEIFKNIPGIKYEGPKSKNNLAFKFYDPDKVVLGKTMKEHLPFAMAWWHNLGAAGTDMFGRDTADKSFGAAKGTMEHAKAKVDAGFEFMQKLGIEYFCFHDVDLVPEADDINVTNARLDEISDYILDKMNATGIKCLWGTANMFSNPRFMNGAGSTNSADVYCFAAAQIKKALGITVKLGGKGYVFWGGREGYETLLNTDMKFEQENIARLMHMAVDYGRKIGFTGDFYIEPKPKEPMKHQYDFDAATAIGFLRQYGLDKDFKEMVEEEYKQAKEDMEKFTEELKILLLPRDPNDDRNVIVEIRGGAGGEESALFAYDLYRMYSMYAETKGFKIEVLNLNETELGGIKEISFMINGEGAYSRFKFESGVHRVQRVPETESGGRIHTSTVTVAVLPEAEEVEFELNEADLIYETYRASGAGGQKVNKTSSAVRVIHVPTGTVVECQVERSQYQNKDRATELLRSRLYNEECRKQQESIDGARRSQVGTGDRSEKIRTYNFPQSRVSDHRIGLTLYKLDAILNGDLDEVIDALITADTAEKMKNNS